MSSTQSRNYRFREFVRRLWVKSVEDEIFFMAGAVAFSALVAIVPLLLLGVGVAGYALSAQVGDPTVALVALVAENFPEPAGGVDLTAAVRGMVEGMVQRRSGFTFVGALFFIWLATRLVGTLRVTLREIFDIGQDRGIVRGKLFDIQVVVIGVLLLTLNLGVTVALGAAVDLGVEFLGLGGPVIGLAERMLGYSVALASIWTLFLVVYRYLPARRIPWRTAIIAATFSAVLHEGLKWGISWYATEVADYRSTFGNLATLAILVLWIYYGSVVFIMGGEVAQVSTMRKASRVQSGAKIQVES